MKQVVIASIIGAAIVGGAILISPKPPVCIDRVEFDVGDEYNGIKGSYCREWA